MSKFLDRFRYFKQKGETSAMISPVRGSAMGMASFSIPTGTGRTDTASVGSMTKSYVQPTG